MGNTFSFQVQLVSVRTVRLLSFTMKIARDNIDADKHSHIGSASFNWPASSVTWTTSWGENICSGACKCQTHWGKKNNCTCEMWGGTGMKDNILQESETMGETDNGWVWWVWEITVKSLQGKCVIFVGWGVRRSATLGCFCKLYTEVEHITRVTYSSQLNIVGRTPGYPFIMLSIFYLKCFKINILNQKSLALHLSCVILSKIPHELYPLKL